MVDVDPGILAQQRRATLDSVQGIELTAPPRGQRLRGTARPGHCSGWFVRGDLGRVWEASDCSLEAVVVRLPDETWALGPADREDFARALRTRSPGVFDAAPLPSPPAWWRALQAVIVLVFAVPLLLLAAVLLPLRYGVAGGVLLVRSPLGGSAMAVRRR